jgi:threonine aldolase
MIDLRSDTVTRPTSEMRTAMAEAEVGDDVFGEDPTAERLQEYAAAIFEREAALFVPTGTMGNQIAVKLHTSPGQEVVVESRGHIFNYEMATMAAFSGCLARPVEAPRGILTWGLIEPSLSPPVYYRARTGLIALENTHNMAGGTVMQLSHLDEIVTGARARSIPVHLDGARIFNAATALGTSVARLARGCDSVMFCLSKGLSAPVGSVLVGSRSLIEEARRVRKMLGGGMRQVGILAAAGMVALQTMPQRLIEDHRNARALAEGLAEMPAFQIDLSTVETNIVITDLNGISSADLIARLESLGIRAVPTGVRQVRFVTHREISRSDVSVALAAISAAVEPLS